MLRRLAGDCFLTKAWEGLWLFLVSDTDWGMQGVIREWTPHLSHWTGKMSPHLSHCMENISPHLSHCMGNMSSHLSHCMGNMSSHLSDCMGIMSLHPYLSPTSSSWYLFCLNHIPLTWKITLFCSRTLWKLGCVFQMMKNGYRVGHHIVTMQILLWLLLAQESDIIPLHF